MVKLGIVVFGNHSGLGNQTRRLTDLLKPYRVLFIDARVFSQNGQAREDWYSGYQGYKVNGFPTNHQIDVFLKELTHVIVCENPLNFYLFDRAKQLGIKTYCQTNYEFCDNLANPELTVPDCFLMPSYWYVEEMKERFGETRVMYLPPPINPNEFKEAREVNFQRRGSVKFLHIVGTLAAHDRNGTLDLLESLKYSQADFTLTINSQRRLPDNYLITDHRVKYISEDIAEVGEMYKDYDAVILPRRYGGLSLVMNEALMAGLPVIMPDISPNNRILPIEWLLPAQKRMDFVARVPIDVFEVSPIDMGRKLDYLVNSDLEKMKLDAFELGYKNFSDTSLRGQYELLLSE